MYTCVNCHERPVAQIDHWCKVCQHQSRLAQEFEQDDDERNWEFALCQFCGSWLDDEGECENGSCGNSSHLGEDDL